VVYAGVDYEKILRQAEHEADVILWDGGNNDTPSAKFSFCCFLGHPCGTNLINPVSRIPDVPD
jgi:predicted GTPase